MANRDLQRLGIKRSRLESPGIGSFSPRDLGLPCSKSSTTVFPSVLYLFLCLKDSERQFWDQGCMKPQMAPEWILQTYKYTYCKVALRIQRVYRDYSNHDGYMKSGPITPLIGVISPKLPICFRPFPHNSIYSWWYCWWLKSCTTWHA